MCGVVVFLLPKTTLHTLGDLQQLPDAVSGLCRSEVETVHCWIFCLVSLKSKIKVSAQHYFALELKTLFQAYVVVAEFNFLPIF